MKATLSILFFVPMFIFGQKTEQVFEGYYQNGWENSSFFELKDDKLDYAIWTVFGDTIKQNDSLINVLSKNNFSNGVYIKFEGKKESENGRRLSPISSYL
ncbi:hypothetical protein LJC16_01815 [Bacteroidales bacterium OttesenSCG-928-C19]|nr:hypothetical protein [Bacteroidales bacterium OttesenSCG-928-C19]